MNFVESSLIYTVEQYLLVYKCSSSLKQGCFSVLEIRTCEMTHAKNHMQTVTLCHTNFRMVTFRNLATNNVSVTVTISRVTCDNHIEKFIFHLQKVTS